MKEIKFRAWDIEEKEMLDCNKPFVYTGEWGINDIFRDVSSFGEGYVFMQYTSLHDKNDKEIYEGDIVDRGVGGYPVEYHYGSFWISGFKLVLLSDIYKTGEVIGNIYENPELIKETA